MAKNRYIFRIYIACFACVLCYALGAQHVDYSEAALGLAGKPLAEKDIPVAQDAIVAESKSLIGLREQKGNRGPIIDAANALVGAPPGSAWCGSIQFYQDIRSIICYSTVRSGYVPSWGAKNNGLIKTWDRKWKGKRSPFVKTGCKFTIYFADMGRDAHTGMIAEVSEDSVFFYSGEGNTSEHTSTGQASREGVIYARKKRRVDTISKCMCPPELLTQTEKQRFK